MSSGGLSNVGARFLYESNQQRTVSRHEINERRRYKEGKPGSHEPYDTQEDPVKKDPTLPVCIKLCTFVFPQIHTYGWNAYVVIYDGCNRPNSTVTNLPRAQKSMLS